MHYRTSHHALRAALVALDTLNQDTLSPSTLVDVTSAVARVLRETQPGWFERYEALRLAAAAGDETALAIFVVRTLAPPARAA